MPVLYNATTTVAAQSIDRQPLWASSVWGTQTSLDVCVPYTELGAVVVVVVVVVVFRVTGGIGGWVGERTQVEFRVTKLDLSIPNPAAVVVVVVIVPEYWQEQRVRVRRSTTLREP